MYRRSFSGAAADSGFSFDLQFELETVGRGAVDLGNVERRTIADDVGAATQGT